MDDGIAVERGQGEGEASKAGELAEGFVGIVAVEREDPLRLGAFDGASPVLGVGERLEDLVGGVRLRDIVVGAGVEALDAVLGGDPGRDHDHGGLPGTLVGLQGLADLESVDVGEHQVQEDDVRRPVADLLQGLGAREGRIGPVAAELDERGQQVVGRGFIFDDQGCGHRSYLAETVGASGSRASGGSGVPSWAEASAWSSDGPPGGLCRGG
jgi:hypothetical protein